MYTAGASVGERKNSGKRGRGAKSYVKFMEPKNLGKIGKKSAAIGGGGIIGGIIAVNIL